MKENDVFPLSKPVEAYVIGQQQSIIVPARTLVTVVCVFGNADSPEAYEVEAYLSDSDTYALATVPSSDV